MKAEFLSKDYFRCCSRFGFINGTKVYLSYCLNGKLRIPNDAIDICLRPRSSDYAVFHQIYINKEYKFKALPKNAEIIIDAGANVGLASRWFASLYPKATILAIEASIRNINHLRNNVKHMQNIFVEHKALWYKFEHLLIDADSREWSDKITTNSYASSSVEGVPVQHAIELSCYYSQSSKSVIDILKMDIEGAERAIFENGASWFSNVKYLIIETHDWVDANSSRAVFTEMLKHNYELEVRGENLLFINRDLIKE